MSGAEPVIDVDLTSGALDVDALLAGVSPDAGLDLAAENIAPDGESVLVSIDGSAFAPMTQILEHEANLAEHMDPRALTKIASQIEDWVEEDLLSRKEWEDCLKDGMATLGIAPMSKGDEPFEGASTVTHPVIAEAAVQFQSRAIEELFPSAGPVKGKTIPNPPEDIIAQAARVEGFFNWFLTEGDEDYYEDSDQMLFIVALHGHIFRKVYADPITREPKARFVTASRLIVPYNAVSLKSADHYTHPHTMPLNDIKRAMAAGHFRNVVFNDGLFQQPDRDAEKEIADEADRKEPSGLGDGIPELYECHCDLVLEGIDEGNGIALPYIVTMEKNTREVLAIYRNWDKEDPNRLKEVWFSSYKYLQGLGFYGLGLFHVLGNIAASCGAILRAIIDAGAFSNLQGGFVAKQAGGRKVDVRLEMGVWKEIDLSPEEMEKAFHTPPFKEPSQTLMLTLRALIESAQRFSSTTEALTGDGPRTGPVGTTIAMIEQSSKVFSAIHKRNHRSLAAEFKCLAKLFRRLNYEYPYPVGPFTLQADLDKRVDVTPVSDPTIVSNTQRIAMAQAAQQVIGAKPQLYGPENQRMADLALLKVMKIPNAEQLVKDYTVKPEPMDPVSENAAILMGKPVKVAPDQDDDAHIQTHINFFMALPPEGQKATHGPGLAHIAEHAASKYKKFMARMLQQVHQQAPPGMTPEQAMAMIPVPPLVPQMSMAPTAAPSGEPSNG